MSETASTVTSGTKSCDACGTVFGDNDDRRYKDCESCRESGTTPATDEPTEAWVEPTVSAGGTTQAEPVPEPAIIDGGPEEFETITVDVEKHKPPPKADREWFLCGVTKDAPHSYYTMGGVNFQKDEGEIRMTGDKMEMVENVRTGTAHQLTVATVDLIQEHVAGKVIRDYRFAETEDEGPTGKFMRIRATGHIKSMAGSRLVPFLPHETDIPVGCFLYMVRIQNKNHRPFEGADVQTMVSREGYDFDR